MNKFVLANILKNFRWLKIRLHDSKLKHLKCPRCYSLSLRYSIYKVQSLRRFRRSLVILSQLFSFVKNFFQVFTNFFERIRFSCSLSPRGDLGILAHRLSFVKNFFQILFNFFSIYSSPCPCGQPWYINTPSSTCQASFLIFQILRVKTFISVLFFFQSRSKDSSPSRPWLQITDSKTFQ